MRFDLTPASYRVLERASRLRLQRGVAAISAAKLLWALFEEEECRAAQWLGEAGLTLKQFLASFGIQMLGSPISAPAFPVGSYGISAGQYAPPPPTSSGIDAARTGNNSYPVGNPYPDQLPPDESNPEHREESELPQDTWEFSEQPKYSLYHTQQGHKPAKQSQLQFFLDEERVNIGIFTENVEDNLEMVALRFIRKDFRQTISTAEGSRQITLGVPTMTLLTEHILLAAVLDQGDVGHWLHENGIESAELYQRIDDLTLGNRRNATAESMGTENIPLEEISLSDSLSDSFPAEKNSSSSLLQEHQDDLVKEFNYSLYRLLDASANRAREAMRVIEDYVRFLLNDASLTLHLKTFRHRFQKVLQQIPIQSRLSARNTEGDVGTTLSAEGEYHRPAVSDLVSANFSRLQESLRSLEEFSKMLDPLVAQQLENLRYECYTLHKKVAMRQGIEPFISVPEEIAFSEKVYSHAKDVLNHALLYVLVDIRSDADEFEHFITSIIAGGADIIQLRDKQADDRTLLDRSRILKNCIAVSNMPVLFIMNDRPDLALAAGADGIHVGQKELPIALVRRIVGDMLVGVSTHSIEQAKQAVQEGADYIGAGPVFESSTKAFSHLAGLPYLQEAAAEIAIPAFAIGGMTADRLDNIFQTGFRRVAVGAAILESENPQQTAEQWKEKLRQAWNHPAVSADDDVNDSTVPLE